MSNAEIINSLTQLSDLYLARGDEYRSKAYRTAANSIQSLTYTLTIDSLAGTKIVGVGAGIKEKIIQLITTGKIKELEKLRLDPATKSYEIFDKILGVGSSTISNWIKMSIYTLSDLRLALAKSLITLNHTQQLGLRYYDDLNTRIPREEVANIGEYMRNMAVETTNSTTNHIIFDIAGSYRREAATSGDIDILICHQRYITSYLEKFLRRVSLTDGFIDEISLGEQRLTFLFCYDKLVRQIDILYLPYKAYYAALMYFTGSGAYNEWLRMTAKKAGYKLNQNGIYKGNKLIPVNSEEDIYKIIGVDYVQPRLRLNGN